MTQAATVAVWDGAGESGTLEGVWDGATVAPVVQVEVHEPTTQEPLTAAGGMTGDANASFTAAGLASLTDGTVAYAWQTLPASKTSFRVSTIVRTPAGGATRQAGVGVATSTDLTTFVSVGIKSLQTYVTRSGGADDAVGPALTADTEYVLSLTYDEVVGRSDELGVLTATVATLAGVLVSNYTINTFQAQPGAYPVLYAYTDQATGSVRDIVLDEHVLSKSRTSRQFRLQSHSHLDVTQLNLLRGSVVAPRLVFLMGGTGNYNGPVGFGEAAGSGWATAARTAVLSTWSQLGDAGFLVSAPQAYGESWGSDRALAEYVGVYNDLTSVLGVAPTVYVIGYSMGGPTAWRAIIGRAGFPIVEAAVIVAGITDYMNWSRTSFPLLASEWPDPALYDSPIDMDLEAIVGRGTRVLMVTSTGDTNVPKATEHDPMFTKLQATSQPTLFTEYVYASGIHFDSMYWDGQQFLSVLDA